MDRLPNTVVWVSPGSSPAASCSYKWVAILVCEICTDTVSVTDHWEVYDPFSYQTVDIAAPVRPAERRP